MDYLAIYTVRFVSIAENGSILTWNLTQFLQSTSV